MMNLRKKLGLAVLLVLGAASAQASMLALDTFDYTVDLLVPTAGPVFIDTASVTNFNVLGGDADYTLTSTGGAFITTATTIDAFAVNTGVLALSNAAGATSTLEIFYSELDGCSSNIGCPPAPALALYGPVDMTDGGFDSFYFDILSIDTSFTISLSVFNGDLAAFDASANDLLAHTGSYSTYTAPSDSFPGLKTISFTDPAWVGAADFTKVTGILVSISGIADSDLTLGEFGISKVPEPTTVALFGLALVGFAFSSRRKAQ